MAFRLRESVIAASFVAVIGLWFLYSTSRPEHRLKVVASRAVDYIRQSDWGALYDASDSRERDIVGLSRTEFTSLMASLSAPVRKQLALLGEPDLRQGHGQALVTWQVKGHGDPRAAGFLVMSSQGQAKPVLSGLPKMVLAVWSGDSRERAGRLAAGLKAIGRRSLVNALNGTELTQERLEAFASGKIEIKQLAKRLEPNP